MNDHQRLYSYSLLVQALAVVIKLRFFQIVNWQLRICYWGQIFGRTQRQKRARCSEGCLRPRLSMSSKDGQIDGSQHVFRHTMCG